MFSIKCSGTIYSHRCTEDLAAFRFFNTSITFVKPVLYFNSVVNCHLVLRIGSFLLSDGHSIFMSRPSLNLEETSFVSADSVHC